ncbi:hypothetical protein D3C85_1515520 [compost metagenome]
MEQIVEQLAAIEVEMSGDVTFDGAVRDRAQQPNPQESTDENQKKLEGKQQEKRELVGVK